MTPLISPVEVLVTLLLVVVSLATTAASPPVIRPLFTSVRLVGDAPLPPWATMP